MSSLKPLQWAGLVLGLGLALYFVYTHVAFFGDVSFLGGILMLEVIVITLWNYAERFFVLLMIAFTWAGLNVPLQGAWRGGGRWVVLAAGAVAGFIVWTRNPRRPFGSMHLIAFFCICAAFVSATVSMYIRMASLKAFSLFLLFLYCASGVRVAISGRENRFFHGLLWACEIAVYATAICYFGLGLSIWGNPNSLGAVASVAFFPVLFWGWLISEGPSLKFRRLVAVLLCTFLVLSSMARAGMVSVMLVTGVLCFCLRQYKLLVKAVALVLLLVAITGMFDPDTLDAHLGGLKDALLYKGHKGEGVLGSRRSPWDQSIAAIKEHPWFGTGFGTSPTGDDPGLDFGTVVSTHEANREHGSSYLSITEWVGLLGALPFVSLLGVTALNLWRVCVWMRRTANPRHYSIPLAMVVLAGLLHAGFEDWLFAVGYYLCVYFWSCAFMLADLVPEPAVAPTTDMVSRTSRPLPAGFRAAVPHPAVPTPLSNR